MFNFGKPKTPGDWIVHIAGAYSQYSLVWWMLRLYVLWTHNPLSGVNEWYGDFHQLSRSEGAYSCEQSSRFKSYLGFKYAQLKRAG